MENVIYLELIKRGFAVDVGIVETAKRNAEGKVVRNYAEVDFIANRGNNKFYIQSAFAMDTEEKQVQEKNSLLNIKDFFKKITKNQCCFFKFNRIVAGSSEVCYTIKSTYRVTLTALWKGGLISCTHFLKRAFYSG